MKFWILAVAAFSLATSSVATAQSTLDEAPAAGAPAGARAIPIYGKANPGRLSDEMLGTGNDVRNVTYPTLTAVLPKPGTANGAAVIVAPGGGFMFLSMDNEGWRVAQALADRGITAFVLKYRLAPTPKDEAAFREGVMKLIMGAAGKGPPVKMDPSHAVADGLAALKLVRGRSAEWGLDPARIGMIGFSAGAITTIGTILEASKDADPATTPPAFAGYVYGPMDAVEVPTDAPPLFAALAMDDGMFGKDNFDLVNSWRNAKRPVELHVYQSGGHGFGLGKQGTTNALLMQEFVTWLEMQGLLGPTSKP